MKHGFPPKVYTTCLHGFKKMCPLQAHVSRLRQSRNCCWDRKTRGGKILASVIKRVPALRIPQVAEVLAMRYPMRSVPDSSAKTDSRLPDSGIRVSISLSVKCHTDPNASSTIVGATNLSSGNDHPSRRHLDNAWVCYNQEESRAYLVLTCSPFAHNYIQGNSNELPR